MKKLTIIFSCFVFSTCTIGKGKGHFHGCLYFPSCSASKYGEEISECSEENENYSMHPDFFAAETLSDGSMLIRIQSDGYWLSDVDGLVLIIPAYKRVSKELDEAEFVDKTVPPSDQVESLPPSERYEASYYFNKSCSENYASFDGGTGSLRLYSLYRPDSDNEEIKGEFDLFFQDSRTYNEDEVAPYLRLTGNFEFQYERGMPAQYFP